MKNPEKAAETVVKEIVREGEAGLPRLIYRLTAGKREGRHSYSVECAAAEPGVLYEDTARLPDVSSDPGTALRVLEALARGGVTPYALTETAEALLGEDF